MGFTEDLQEVFDAFVEAQSERDAAWEIFQDGLRGLRAANVKYDNALLDMAELVGRAAVDADGDAEFSIDGMLGFGGGKGKSFGLPDFGNIFGDLF